MSRKVMQVDGPSHFSGGNLSYNSEESRTMPRKVMQVDGPSHFVVTGTPILSQTQNMVDLADRLFWRVNQEEVIQVME